MKTRCAALRSMLGGLALLATAAAAEAQPPAIEDAYLSLLAGWGRGSPEALAEISDLHQRLASHLAGFEITSETYALLSTAGTRGHRPKRRKELGHHGPSGALPRVLPGSRCWHQIQEHVDERLLATDPAAFLPLAFLHAQLYSRQTGPIFRPWLAVFSKARSFALIDAYLATAEPPEVAQRNAISLLVALADRFLHFSFVESGVEARDAYLGVLRLDPENRVALYWLGFLQEMLGNYPQAVRVLEKLASASPEDTETVLRLAINRSRVGAVEPATATLESIARGAAAERFRVVAYQELGRLYADSAPDRAATYLREATGSFPAHPRLHLQLSNLLTSEWQRSATLARQVETAWRGDPGRSQRLLYSEPRRVEIEPELRRLEREVERHKAVLATALAPLLALPEAERLRLPSCPRGLLR